MINLLYLENDPSVYPSVLTTLEDLQASGDIPGLNVMHVMSHAGASLRLAQAHIILSDCYCPGKIIQPDGKPGLGGFDLLRDVQEIEDAPGGRCIPFAFSSGSNPIDVLEQMKAYKLRLLPKGHFVEKPLNFRTIKKIIGLLVKEFTGEPEPAESSTPAHQPITYAAG